MSISHRSTWRRPAAAAGAGLTLFAAVPGADAASASATGFVVKAHYGRGTIDCGGGRDVLYVSRKAQRNSRITRCETVSHRTLGY